MFHSVLSFFAALACLTTVAKGQVSVTSGFITGNTGGHGQFQNGQPWSFTESASGTVVLGIDGGGGGSTSGGIVGVGSASSSISFYADPTGFGWSGSAEAQFDGGDIGATGVVFTSATGDMTFSINEPVLFSFESTCHLEVISGAATPYGLLAGVYRLSGSVDATSFGGLSSGGGSCSVQFVRPPDCAGGWQWSRMPASETPLPLRFGHSAAYDSDRHEVVVIGGGAPDMLRFDGGQWASEPFVDGPTDGPLAYDRLRHRLVAFDGGTLWEWDGTQWLAPEFITPAPAWRTGHAMAYDEARGVIVLFGGQRTDNNQPLGDTWTWDGLNWTVRNVAGPSPRSDHHMAYDRVRQRVVLAGGIAGGPGANFNTWEWDGQAWTPRVQSAPSLGNLTFDAARGKIVAIPYLPGTWAELLELDGSAWVQRDIAGPFGVLGAGEAALTFHEALGRSVFLGATDAINATTGLQGEPVMETWSVGTIMTEPAIAVQPMPQSLASGEMLRLRVAMTGWGPFTYQWRRNGVPIPAGPGTYGQSQRTLFIVPTTAAHSGMYDVVISSNCGTLTSAPANVLVGCRADFNGSASATVQDIYDFLADWNSQSSGGPVNIASADFNAVSGVTVQDIYDFLVAWSAGCS